MQTKIKTLTTINGSVFDTPSQINVDRSEDIPTCELTFPRRIGSRFRATKKDCIRVYVGIGSMPTILDTPIFSGYVEHERGYDETILKLIGIQGRCHKEQMVVDKNNNYDGSEISTVILSVLKSVNELQTAGIIQSKFFIQATNPQVKVPKDTHYDRGTTKWEFIRDLTDMTKDQYNMNTRNYALFVVGDNFYFRKEPRRFLDAPHIIIPYGSGLIDFEETDEGSDTINRITVIGKDKVKATYTNLHRLRTDGLREGQPINDDSIKNAGEGYDVARLFVQSRLFDTHSLTIESLSLLHAIPGYSLVQLTGAPYGLSGKYIVSGVNINISSSNFYISGELNRHGETISDALSEALNLNNSIYPR